MKYLLLILLTACSSQQPKRYAIETRVIGFKCPQSMYLNQDSTQCLKVAEIDANELLDDLEIYEDEYDGEVELGATSLYISKDVNTRKFDVDNINIVRE